MDEEIKIEGNIDINQALKEFEIKSTVEQVQKTAINKKTPDIPKMVQLVMKWSGGAIKEQRQAEYILLGFVVLAIIISLFLFFGASRKMNLSTQESNFLNSPNGPKTPVQYDANLFSH
jgi:hypothetical protein